MPLNRYFPLASVTVVCTAPPDAGQAPANNPTLAFAMPSSVASWTLLPFQSRKTVSPIVPTATVTGAVGVPPITLPL
jgi:hypothetical protein